MPVRLTLRPAPDEMFTIQPARAFFIAGMTARVQRNALVRFASTIARQSSSLTSSSGRPTWPQTPPALLTSTSMRPTRSTSRATWRGSARSAVSRSTRWTVAPSSSSPAAIAAPIPCAVPATSATLPPSSGIGAPPVLEQVPHLRHAGPPDIEHLRLGSLVGAAEVPVDGQPTQLVGRRLPDAARRDRRLRAPGHDDPGKARPGEVLHPGAMRGLLLVALHDLPDARSVPPVVEEQLPPRTSRLRQPLAKHARRRRVAAVAVDQRDAAEALPEQRIEKITDDRDIGAHAQARTAGECGEVRRHAVGKCREDRNAERLGRFHRDALGEDRIGPDREVAVLFGGSDRQHDAVVMLEVVLEHLPVAVVDPHERLPRRATG